MFYIYVLLCLYVYLYNAGIYILIFVSVLYYLFIYLFMYNRNFKCVFKYIEKKGHDLRVPKYNFFFVNYNCCLVHVTLVLINFLLKRFTSTCLIKKYYLSNTYIHTIYINLFN